MEFDALLKKAQEGNQDAVLEIFEMYQPLLIKNAIVDERFDQELYQELSKTFLECIARFREK